MISAVQAMLLVQEKVTGTAMLVETLDLTPPARPTEAGVIAIAVKVTEVQGGQDPLETIVVAMVEIMEETAVMAAMAEADTNNFP